MKPVERKEHPMSNRVLVTYATRTRSTAEVATVISDVLTTRGFTVQVKPVKEKPSLEGYHGVILGSAIRMGGWLPEMLEFIRINQAKLNEVPTAIFTVHILNTGKGSANHDAQRAYTVPVRKMLNPVDEAFFAGNLDLSKLSFLDGVLTKIMVDDQGLKVGDLRDWEKIRAWAKEVSV
jgi:menaquinone-dependent protoporphyrinogen oxidase